MQQSSSPNLNGWVKAGLTTALLLGVGVWAYWPSLLGLVRVWDTDPNYSQGYLIPLLALGLLVLRLRSDGTPGPRPALYTGLALLTTSVAARFVSAWYFVIPLEHASILLALVGITLAVGGWPWLVRSWPAIALLVFAFPIPNSLGGGELVSGLQTVSTRASTFTLQMLGLVAVRDGNTIILKSGQLGVVEACSGLRMLMVFCALATVTAVLLPGSWIRKSLLIASAIPLAILCNVMRITAAGIACESLGSETGYFIFHDLAGWLMVPTAFLLFTIEVCVLGKLFRAADGAPPPPSSGQKNQSSRR